MYRNECGRQFFSYSDAVFNVCSYNENDSGILYDALRNYVIAYFFCCRRCVMQCYFKCKKERGLGNEITYFKIFMGSNSCYNYGLVQPLVLDLSIIKLTFGFSVNINIAVVLGIIISAVVYRYLF